MMSMATTSFDASCSHLGSVALLRATQGDGFRAKLQEDPASVLAQLGIEVDVEQLPESVALPSKQAVEGGLQQFAAGLFDKQWAPFIGD